jgi:RNA polymerase sigma-70 factor (ECF subfamily)
VRMGMGRNVLETVDRHQARLLAYANSITNNVESAKETVQETFCRFFALDKMIEEPRLAAWLFHVCRNLSIDCVRRQRRLHPIDDREEEASENGTADVVELRKDSETVLLALEKLPKNQAEVLRLKFLCDLTYREISEVTELSVGNVGYLIHHGLKAIREKLEPSANVVEMRR